MATRFDLVGQTPGYLDILRGAGAVQQLQGNQQQMQLRGQQAQMQQQQLAQQQQQGQLETQEAERTNALRRLNTFGEALQSVSGLPYEQRRGAIASMMPVLTTLGLEPDQVQNFDPTDANIQPMLDQARIAFRELNPTASRPTELQRNLQSAGIGPDDPRYQQIVVANAGASALPGWMVMTPQGAQQIPGTLTPEQQEMVRADRDAANAARQDARFFAGLEASDQRTAAQIAAADRRQAETLGARERQQRQQQQQRAERVEMAVRDQEAKAARIISKVDEIIPRISRATAGFAGEQLARIPGSAARDIRSDIETVKANLGFQELQAMRDASPTGGALGQVAVQELVALQSTVASLDASQSPDQLRRNLEQVRQHYEGWLNATKGAARDEGAAVPAPSGIPAGWSVRVR